jgi:hypothetical protein
MTASEAGSVWGEGVAAWWASLRDLLAGEGPFVPGAWRDVARLSHPVEPFNRPDFVAPLVGIAGILLGVLLTGVALASLGALLVSILGLALLLTRVFGISVELAE